MNRQMLVLCALLLQAGNGHAQLSGLVAGASDEDIDAKVGELDENAILEAGKRGRKDLAQKLERIAASDEVSSDEIRKRAGGHKENEASIRKMLEPKQKRARLAARKALARMGDEKYLKGFVVELKSKGWTKAEAIKALGYAGDRRAIKHLAALLDDNDSPPSTKHEPAPSYGNMAEQALAEIAPEVRDEFKRKNPGRRFFFKKEWKDWWTKNKDAHQKGIE